MATGSLSNGGVRIVFEEHGRGGVPLVLVHGFTGARSDFESHFKDLSHDRRVLAGDHRGHGGSTNTGKAGSYTLEALTQDLIALLETRLEGPAHVLGHSMGGMVVVRLALARPDLVHSLVLMDTAAEALAAPALPPGTDDLVRSQGLPALFALLPKTPERALLLESKGDAWIESDAKRRLEAMDPEAFLALFPEVFRGPSLLDRLGAIRCPTTVLVGSRDAAFLEPSQHLADGIPGARLERVDGAYHSPQHTHPDAWLALVRAHLDRAGRG